MLLSNLSGTTLPSVTQLPATPIMPVTGSSPEGHDSIVPLFKYIKLNPGSNLTCSEAPPNEANATYLYGVDNRTCTTTMTSAHPIVLTGRYSGCILTVSEISEEEYCVAHVYNGGSNPGLIEDTKKYLKAIKAKKTTAV